MKEMPRACYSKRVWRFHDLSECTTLPNSTYSEARKLFKLYPFGFSLRLHYIGSLHWHDGLHHWPLWFDSVSSLPFFLKVSDRTESSNPIII